MTIRKLLNFWFGKNRSGFYVFLGIAAACAYLAGIALERSENQALAQTLKQAGYFSFLAIAPAYFIHWNLHAAHWFLDHFKDTDHLPKKTDKPGKFLFHDHLSDPDPWSPAPVRLLP